MRYFCSEACLVAEVQPRALVDAPRVERGDGPLDAPVLHRRAPPHEGDGAQARAPRRSADVNTVPVVARRDEVDGHAGEDENESPGEAPRFIELSRDSEPDVDAPAKPAPAQSVTRVVPVDASARAPALWEVGAVAACALVAFTVAQAAPLGATAAAALTAPFVFGAVAVTLRSVAQLRALRVGRSLAWAFVPLGVLGFVLHAARSPAPVARVLADLSTLCIAPAVSAWIARRMLVATRAAQAELERVLSVAASQEGVEALRAGDEFALEAGAALAADVLVTRGSGTAWRFPGSHRAVPFAEGDVLLAGGRLERGEALALALRVGPAASVARLLAGVHRDEAPASIARLADRAVLAFPFLSLLVGFVAAQARDVPDVLALLGSVGATWIAAPVGLMALAARIPWRAAMLEGVTLGVLYRDGASIEATARVRAVLFCAHGTVTYGAPDLVECVCFGSIAEREIVALAASAEEPAGSHALAVALRRAAQARGLSLEPLRRAAYVGGRGVSGVTTSGSTVRVGNRELLLAEGVSIARSEDAAAAIEAQRRTAVFVAVDERVEAVLGFEDLLRTEARAAAQALVDLGLDLALFGGSSRGSLDAIGSALDVADVRPEVAPEERESVVRALGDVAERVAVLGQPARDAVALAAASVGVALSPPRAGGEPSIVLAEADLRLAVTAFARARTARTRAWGATAIAAMASALIAFVATTPATPAMALALLAAGASVAVAVWLGRR